MNDVVTLDQARPRPAIVAGNKPQAIVPSDFDSCYRLATAICASGIMPQGIDTPEKAMVAIMHGLEIGLPPMAAMQRIAVVNGRPTIWGDAAMGLVRASGLCEYVSETVEGDGDARVATCEAKRKGDPKPVIRTFSVADAKRAGLWSPEARVTRYKKDGGTYQKGNDSPWHRYPDRMMQMRARAFALRDLFADVLGGLHLREEIDDEPRNVEAKEPPPPPPPPPPAVAQIEAKAASEPPPPAAAKEPAPPPGASAKEPPPPPPGAAPARDNRPLIERYKDAIATAKDGDELDAIFNEMIGPHSGDMGREQWDEFCALDNARRGELEA